jgi:tetratricopeptide (TPR) repeat protein
VRRVSDQDRKGKASERDEDAEETAASDEAEQTEKEAASGEQDDAAHRVAEALGVGDEEGPPKLVEEAEKATEEGSEDAPAPNRAQRRAEAAKRRKKRKAAAEAPAEDEAAAEAEADEDLPKDKNARAKELLKRRREQAATTRQPVQLLPTEMVDDALARSASAVGKWVRKNFGVIQWVIVAVAVTGGGWAFWVSQGEKKVGNISDDLAAGMRAERGRVMAEDKRSDDEKEADPTKIFKTAEEKADTALASYRKVINDAPGTGAAILARLEEAGVLLEKRDWDKAREAFSQVSSSTLAGADPDVKVRALEGLGFAKEGKNELDSALATFKEIEAVAGGKFGYKELSQYHQGRVYLAKGDKEKAKELLKAAHDALEKPSDGAPHGFLKAVVDETLRRIDPALVPPKPTIGGGAKGASMSPEELQRAIQRMQENLAKSKEKEKHE